MSHIIKYGGRLKGTPNKATAIHREYIQTLLDNQKDKIEAELNTLKGKEYLSVILSLMDFTMPKLSRLTYQDENQLPQLENIIISGVKYARSEPTKVFIELPVGSKVEM